MLQKKPTLPSFPSSILTCVLFIAVCFHTSCTSSKYPLDSTGPYIEFGHGGGFAGIEYRYILLQDGRVFKHDTQPIYQFRLPSGQAKQLFNNIIDIYNKEVTINDPGNTYQFITYYHQDQNERWVWNSSNQITFDKHLRINHSILMKFIHDNEHAHNQ